MSNVNLIQPIQRMNNMPHLPQNRPNAISKNHSDHKATICNFKDCLRAAMTTEFVSG